MGFGFGPVRNPKTLRKRRSSSETNLFKVSVLSFFYMVLFSSLLFFGTYNVHGKLV